jgi:hypothetical protein
MRVVYAMVWIGLLITGCDSRQQPLIPKDKHSKAEMANTLFAFVGEQISIRETPTPEGGLDAVFEATYKVLQRVYGHYEGDTITFAVYDHYGVPPFSRYKNALLFVSQSTSGWYHEKYQFFAVYPTQDGRWAGSYNRHAYPDTSKAGAVKPVSIDFSPEVFISLEGKTWEEGEIEYNYPEPYYTIDDCKAFPVYGNYVEDLFRLKKEGVLQARGLFGNGEPNQMETLDTQMAEAIPAYEANDPHFTANWEKLAAALEHYDTPALHKMMLDTLLVCDSLVDSGWFVAECLPYIADAKLLARLHERSAQSSFYYTIDKQRLPWGAAQKVVKEKGGYRCWKVHFDYKERYEQYRRCAFQFVRTLQGFRLYGYSDNADRCWGKGR